MLINGFIINDLKYCFYCFIMNYGSTDTSPLIFLRSKIQYIMPSETDVCDICREEFSFELDIDIAEIEKFKIEIRLWKCKECGCLITKNKHYYFQFLEEPLCSECGKDLEICRKIEKDGVFFEGYKICGKVFDYVEEGGRVEEIIVCDEHYEKASYCEVCEELLFYDHLHEIIIGEKLHYLCVDCKQEYEKDRVYFWEGRFRYKVSRYCIVCDRNIQVGEADHILFTYYRNHFANNCIDCAEHKEIIKDALKVEYLIINYEPTLNHSDIGINNFIELSTKSLNIFYNNINFKFRPDQGTASYIISPDYGNPSIDRLILKFLMKGLKRFHGSNFDQLLFRKIRLKVFRKQIRVFRDGIKIGQFDLRGIIPENSEKITISNMIIYFLSRISNIVLGITKN